MNSMLQVFRPKKKESDAIASAGFVDPPPGESRSDYLTVLQRLIDGRFADVPPGDDAVGIKLRELADELARTARVEVERVVDLSVNINRSMIAISEMIGHTRDVDGRAQHVATAAEELQATIAEITRTSTTVAAEADQARTVADQARDAGGQAIAAIEEISVSSSDTVRKVESLNDSSATIGGIVDQIEAIARQTNLLALNATIEAARAGAAGKGFAVVAIEVKELASETAKATEDIRRRIEALREEIASISASMDVSARAVERGREVVTASGRAVAEVSELVGRVSAQMQDMAGILDQQREATEAVSHGITDIACLSQANMDQIDAVLTLMDEPDTLLKSTIDDLIGGDSCFTLQAAKSDHMIWRKQLAEMVAGHAALDPNELADHHHCRLGKWYYAQADSRMISHRSFKAIEEPHAKLHQLGIAAARAYKAGDVDGAIRLIGESAEQSERVLALLDDLWKAC